MDAAQWLIAGATLALAGVTVFLGLQTRDAARETAKAAKAAQADADASAALVDETRRGRALEVRPWIAFGGSSGETDGMPAHRVRNIGRGPALSVRLVQKAAGEVFWSIGTFFIPPGEYVPASEGQMVPLGDRRGAASVEPSLAGDGRNNVVAYCRDELGNGLRFVMRTGEPPEVWLRGSPPPPWATALDEPFDWRPADQRQVPKDLAGNARPPE